MTAEQFVRTLLWVTTKHTRGLTLTDELSRVTDALYRATELGNELLTSEQFSIITADIAAAKVAAEFVKAEKAARDFTSLISARKREAEAAAAIATRCRQEWEQKVRAQAAKAPPQVASRPLDDDPE